MKFLLRTNLSKRAIKTSHGNVGKLVIDGDSNLVKTSSNIAADEVCTETIARDADGLSEAFAHA